MWVTRSVVHAKECEVCKEDLVVYRETYEHDEDRVIATDRKDGKRHVCFSLPQDANLLIMGDM